MKLSWDNLRDQFGQEYVNSKDFKKDFKNILHQVQTVYPEAKLEEAIGGIILHESKPPLSQTKIAFSLPFK